MTKLSRPERRTDLGNPDGVQATSRFGIEACARNTEMFGIGVNKVAGINWKA